MSANDTSAVGVAPKSVQMNRSRKRCSVTMLHWSIGGLVFLSAALLVGVILSLTGANGNNGNVKPRMTASQWEAIGGEISLLTKPWEPANTQWLLGMSLVINFVVRKYLCPFLTARVYSELPDHKQVKICNYIHELIGTSVALSVNAYGGLFTLLLNPSEYEPHPNVQEVYKQALGLQFMFTCFIPMYILELALDQHMRAGLTLHHWITIITSLWALIMLYEVQFDMWAVRMFFPFALYMSTEQNVFFQMLAYHRKLYWPTCYTLSAWYYLLTRIVITFLSFWTWWDCRDTVFSDGAHNSALVYALWLFIPPANLILNATQLTTVISLFGIAQNVRKRVVQQEEEKELSDAQSSTHESEGDNEPVRRTESHHSTFPHRCRLEETFSQIDSDDSGLISFAEWKAYILNLDLDLILPHWAIESLFDNIVQDGCHEIQSTDFEEFFMKFAAPPCVKFKSIMMGALLKNMLEANIDIHYRALLVYKFDALLNGIRQQGGRTLGSSWAILPCILRPKSDEDIASPPMMKTLTEPTSPSMTKTWAEPTHDRSGTKVTDIV